MMSKTATANFNTKEENNSVDKLSQRHDKAKPIIMSKIEFQKTVGSQGFEKNTSLP